MNKLIKISWLFITLALASLAACGGGTPTTPTADANMVYTQMWETVQIAQTQTALSIPTDTITPEATPTLEASNTPLNTDTPLPGTPSVTPAATTRPVGGGTTGSSCDNAQFVDDVTIPDGAEVTAGSTFVKTWRFKNLGPCTWTTSYHLVYSYVSDNGLKGVFTPPAQVAFPKQVLPGEEVDISVTLTAPSKADSYTAWFVLQNDKGFNIPLASNTYEFWVAFTSK